MDNDRSKKSTSVEAEPWWNKNFSFFSNKACEYFPCHKTGKKEEFNCLFCYCPLYPLQDRCGGNFSYSHGIKDCSGCMLPHQKRSYGYIMSKFGEIAEIAKIREEEVAETEKVKEK
ncbi:MAG TPA: cysteine-rich small domain-containing protein [Bacillota bacterium]|nr:cysteine-rich small domain-containing protein [Bacillota bacterium]